MIRVVFWQNILAFHQVAHITALAQMTGFQVVWVVKEELYADRKALGWSVPDVSKVMTVIGPSDDQIQQLVADRPEQSVHIFTGVFLEPLARKAFSICVRSSATVGLLNEPPIPGHPLRNLAIRPLHRLHKAIFGRRISFIFAIGQMSVDFYQSIGYPSEIIYPFGYFPQISALPESARPTDDPVSLIYIGQLIARKGVDILLNALAELRDLNWRLTIVGGGIAKDDLQALAEKVEISEHVSFRPSVPNAEATAIIAESDLLILPSRHDGWGAVVNEALQCGVPVIASDHCGAADLIKDEWRGGTFRAGSTSDLAAKLRPWIEEGRRTEAQTIRIQSWCRNITGEAAAVYVAEVINYCAASPQSRPSNRPIAPWLAASTAGS